MPFMLLSYSYSLFLKKTDRMQLKTMQTITKINNIGPIHGYKQLGLATDTYL